MERGCAAGPARGLTCVQSPPRCSASCRVASILSSTNMANLVGIDFTTGPMLQRDLHCLCCPVPTSERLLLWQLCILRGQLDEMGAVQAHPIGSALSC